MGAKIGCWALVMTVLCHSAFGATAVLVDLPSGTPDSFWALLKADLAADAVSQRAGATQWIRRGEWRRDVEFEAILEVRVEGNCASGLKSGREATLGPLGWVYQSNGTISPFAFVNCDRIVRAIAPDLREKTIGIQQRKLAQAVSHVIVHEVNHIATQETTHKRTGIQKAYFTRKDLVAAVLR
jgi:hypothetical protein